MTLEEFIALDPKKIRRSEGLMRLFVEFYEAAFSLKPNCAGCTFNKGFGRLKIYAKKGTTKTIVMKSEKKTFLLKPKYRSKILTYKENGKTYRKYGHSIDEDFANKLVEYGKGDVFAKLPEVEEKQSSKYDAMDWKEEVLPLYAEVKERTGNKAESRKKEDVIAFLIANEG